MAADDDTNDNDNDIIAEIETKETENGVIVLSSDLMDDNEEELSSDTNVSYDFKTEVTVE